MTDNKISPVSIWPVVLKYGLVIAAFRVVYNLILYATGLAGTTGLGLVGIIGAIALLAVALNRYRRLNGDYMTFGQAFAIGFTASAISTGIRAIADTIYLASLGREFLAAQLQETLNRVTNTNMDPQALEALTGFFEALFTPGGMFIAAVVTGIIGWSVLSLIIAAIMKRPPPITD